MRIGIIGLGLMGASFGRTLKGRSDATVLGLDIDPSVLLKATLIGCIDKELTVADAASLDLLVVSVFPRDFLSVVSPYLPHMKKGATVLDFCGNKRSVCQAMRTLADQYPDLYFIGGHPMAGREYSGIDHSTKTLFDRASMLLVPIQSDIYENERLKDLFLSLGFGEVIFTNAEQHDRTIAFTSQLCHIVSNAYIKSETAKAHHGFSAGSYRDLTRVARLNPTMWSQLMIDNADLLTGELSTLIESLSAYRDALQKRDEDTLCRLLDEGNQLKLMIDARKQK